MGLKINAMHSKTEISDQENRVTEHESGTARRPFSWQRFLLRIVIVVVLVSLLNSGTDILIASSALWSRFITSSTATTGEPEMFRFHYTLPWGTLRLDGQALAYAPRSDQNYPIGIPAGKHTLTLDSEPFPLFQCTFFVPTRMSADETCKVQQQKSDAGASLITILSFPVNPSLALLTGSQRQVLELAVQKYLDTLQSHERVQQGEPYRYKLTGRTQIARAPLATQLRFVLDTDTARPAACTVPTLGDKCGLTGTSDDCRLFCTLPVAYDGIGDGVQNWEVGVILRPTWTYGDAPVPASEQTGDQQYTLLLIRWEQGTWRIQRYNPQASSLSDPNCVIAMGIVVDRLQNETATTSGPQANDWNFTSSRDRAQGCAITISTQEQDAQSRKMRQGKAYLLWRFDVLLAVNQEAQRLMPDLPVAPVGDSAVLQAILDHADSTS